MSMLYLYLRLKGTGQPRTSHQSHHSYHSQPLLMFIADLDQLSNYRLYSVSLNPKILDRLGWRQRRFVRFHKRDSVKSNILNPYG